MKKDVGQLFRDAFADYSPEFNPEGFEHVRVRIARARRRRLRRRLATAAAIVGFSGLALLLVPSRHTEQPLGIDARDAVRPELSETHTSELIQSPVSAPVSVQSVQPSETQVVGGGQSPVSASEGLTINSIDPVSTVSSSRQVPANNAIVQIPGSNARTSTAASSNQESGVVDETVVSFSSDTAICLGGQARLTVYGAQFCIWVDGQTGSSILVEPQRTTSYTVEATGFDGKLITGRIMVKVDDCESVFIPSAFTPDGDGLNDVFQISGADVLNFNLKIFSRNGQLIFESNEMSKGWAGDIQGNPAPEGAYIFIATYLNKVGTPVSRRGSITLLR